jgi:hypothetical protein
VSEFRFPSVSQRVTVVGRTGSGKTYKGAWLLSNAPFDRQPYVIVDYKGDELLNGIERIREIGLNEPLPKQPGLYIVHPHIHDHETTEEWLWSVWKKGNTGLYFDEAYMLPNSGYTRRGALQAILTQGRSKHIPVISLVQRPSQISLFVMSEADFFSVFHLHRVQDQKTMSDLLGGNAVMEHNEHNEFHSKWFDVGKHRVFNMLPVPDGDVISDAINSRLEIKKRWL